MGVLWKARRSPVEANSERRLPHMAIRGSVGLAMHAVRYLHGKARVRVMACEVADEPGAVGQNDRMLGV